MLIKLVFYFLGNSCSNERFSHYQIVIDDVIKQLNFVCEYCSNKIEVMSYLSVMPIFGRPPGRLEELKIWVRDAHQFGCVWPTVDGRRLYIEPGGIRSYSVSRNPYFLDLVDSEFQINPCKKFFL
jgi:hypothetical protein